MMFVFTMNTEYNIAHVVDNVFIYGGKVRISFTALQSNENSQ